MQCPCLFRLRRFYVFDDRRVVFFITVLHAQLKLGFAKPPVRVHIPTNLLTVFAGLDAFFKRGFLLILVCNGNPGKGQRPQTQEVEETNDENSLFQRIHTEPP